MTFIHSSFPGVLVLTQIINPFRTIPFNMKDQFGLAYGGLRGAISFALAFTLPDNIGRKQLFVTATIAIILFTVFLQVREWLHSTHRAQLFWCESFGIQAHIIMIYSLNECL